jgi:hypothetical protein
LAVGGKRCEEFVWKRNGDALHGLKIQEESVKSELVAERK